MNPAASSFPTRGTSGAPALLAQLGFPALATTSSGFAWSIGRRDNGVTLEEALAHFRAIAAARRRAGQRRLRRRLRDRARGRGRQRRARCRRPAWPGCRSRTRLAMPRDPLFDFELAVERVRAARQAIDDGGTGVLLTGALRGLHRRPAGSRRDACGGSKPTPRPAPIACMRPASEPRRDRRGGSRRGAEAGERAGRRRFHDRRGAGRARACGGSASAARWPARRGPASSRRRSEIAEHGTFGRLGQALPFGEVNGWFPRE